jgi:adenine deaminase
MKVTGMLVDVHERSTYPAIINFIDGLIISIEKTNETPTCFILPGLIDAHIHIESSMITPAAFAWTAVKHGTTGVVSDPHEIANVIGIEGINFMINEAGKVPLNFWFGAPSCVPATEMESSGASIDHAEIEKLLSRKEIKYLSEMMNFPGVICGNKEVRSKLNAAKKNFKPIDGHAPGLTGEALKKYVSAGISTDHECSTLKEAEEKISLGMKILIREGSAARNLEALKNLIKINPQMVMLCSDDLHPEMLVARHINKIVAQLISEGFNKYDVIKCCTVNPVKHYGLEAGLLKAGQSADFILVDDIKKMNVLETWIRGNKVYDRGTVYFNFERAKKINNFNCSAIKTEDIIIPKTSKKMLVIEAFDGELFTKKVISDTGKKRNVESNIKEDILKIVVKDRYNNTPPSVAFIKGFGLKHGAFGSSVAHDSHNIICVGTTDEDIVSAVNEIIRLQGGLAVSSGEKISSLKLSIAGIMSDNSCEEVAADYEALTQKVKSMGGRLNAPFMTLSFMALLVIPELKLSDKGLFDGEKFSFTSLLVD